MAIQTVAGCLTDDCADTIEQTTGNTATTCYKTQVCNTKPPTKLELTGTVWSGQYYNQQLENDDALWNHDNYTSPVYQNYVRINNFPIILDGSIVPTMDAQNQLVTATGSGRAPNLVRLHVGDVIVGPVGDQMYMFTVTEVVPISISDTTWSNISFSLIGPAITGNGTYDNLQGKTVDTLIYDNEYGLISSDDSEERADLTPFLNGALANYMKRMVDVDGRITLTSGGKAVYDPEMAKLVSSLDGMVGGCGTSLVKAPPISKGAGNYLIDVILNRSLGLTSNMCTSRCMFRIDDATVPSQDYIYLTSIAEFVIGTDYDFQADSHEGEIRCPPINDDGDDDDDASTCLVLDPPCCGCGEDPLNDVNTDYGRVIEYNGVDIPIIKDPLEDDNYIFTQAFYDGDLANMSYLEIMVHRYLHNEEVTIADVMKLWIDVVHWCSHSLFFYLPLLILLSKYAMAKKGDCTIAAT